MLSLVLTGHVATLLGLQFFPKADTHMMYLNVVSHGSGNIQQTELIVDQVADILNDEIPVKAYTSAIGGDLPKFFLTHYQTALRHKIMVK